KKMKELQENNQNPFSVPEGYFETFPSKIQEKIISESKQENWFLRFFHIVKPQLALSIMMAGFAIIAITVIDTIMTNRSSSPASNEVYTRIIEVDASEYSEQQFIDILLEDEQEIIKNQKKEETDQYIDYLMDEDIDFGTLIDEL
ncbi:MAG: hypothetical protein ACOCWW_00790, partial [Bacteroidota bacterium]